MMSLVMRSKWNRMLSLFQNIFRGARCHEFWWCCDLDRSVRNWLVVGEISGLHFRVSLPHYWIKRVSWENSDGLPWLKMFSNRALEYSLLLESREREKEGTSGSGAEAGQRPQTSRSFLNSTSTWSKPKLPPLLCRYDEFRGQCKVPKLNFRD